MIKTFGERIRELREKKDLSLREFATRLGVSAAFASDVELGRRHPSDKVLADMARELDTTLEDLRKYDTRAPVQDLKRLTAKNPAYGIAFRKLIDKKYSPEELLKLIEKKSSREKKE